MEAFKNRFKNPLGGLSQLLAKLNLPAFDAAAIVEARRKDIEAVVEANRIVYAGAQALAQKQMEILRATMSAARSHVNDGTFSGTPLEVAARQRELMTKAFQMALGHMRELAEIVRTAQSDAFAVVKEQVTGDILDLVGRVQRKGAPAARPKAASKPTPVPVAKPKPAAKAPAKRAPTVATKLAPKVKANAKPAAKAPAAPAPAAKTTTKRKAAPKPTARKQKPVSGLG